MLALGAFGTQPAFAAAAKKSATSADEVAVMETTKGRMVIEFWDKEAPQTVDNFKKLARQGYFDGTGFHRIIKGFMIQGGDPKSKNPKAPDLGTGDPGYKIKDEFNSHKHVAGVLSMANSGTPNSAGSQFFIMDGAAPFLDGKYTAFGHLIEGMNVEKDIASTPVGPNAMMGGEKSKPLEWTTVKSVKIVPRSSLAKAGGAPASAKPAAATEVKSVPAPASTPASTDAAAAKAAEASAAPAKTEPAAPPPASTEAKPDSAK
jgi:peptidyl-prolyl cis-trans isomerase B (cyclophilin B)